MEEERLDKSKPLKKNPFDRSNIISKIFFCWLLPYFKKGYNRELTEDDMYQHRKQLDSGRLGDKMEEAWNRQRAKNGHPSLKKVLGKVFITEIVLLGVYSLITETIRLLQPLMIRKIMMSYEAIETSGEKIKIYQYAFLIVLSTFFYIFCINSLSIQIIQVGIKMKVALSSLVYRKALRLSTSALAETTIGQIINLMANDVARFESSFIFLHQLWIVPLEMCVIMYLCCNSVGYTSLTGIMIMFICMPIQSILGRKISKFRFNIASRTDERVCLMNEIISGIQVIKMYTWEQPFCKLVERVRNREMDYIRRSFTIKSILTCYAMISERVAVFACILVYILTGNTINSTYVFTLISFYRLLSIGTGSYPVAVTQFSEILVSIRRIRSFLLVEEKQPKLLEGVAKNRNVGIHVNEATFVLLKTLPETILQDVTMIVESGQLVAVIGPVGSGKTTLLNVILKELEPQSGSVEVTGRVSYAPQVPWLFGCSIRQNILFGQKFDQQKYDEVVRVCALQMDINRFPHGDRTLVGERGVLLSGGQKARVNLARALYKDADIYLLDDPLTAVDTQVGKQLFDNCIRGYLAGKCVVLVTHQLQFLKHVSHIYLLEKGKVFVARSYEDIQKSGIHLTDLLENTDDEQKEFKRDSKLILEEVDREKEVQILEREVRGSGNISWHVYSSYVRAAGNTMKAVTVLMAFMLSQAVGIFFEIFIAYWVNIQQSVSQKVSSNTTSKNGIIPKRISVSSVVSLLESNRTGYLAKSSSSKSETSPSSSRLPSILQFLLEQVRSLLNWTNTEASQELLMNSNDSQYSTGHIVPSSNENTSVLPETSVICSDDCSEKPWLRPIFVGNYTIVYYAMLIILVVALHFFNCVTLYRWSLTASSKMHQKMFNCIVRSPMKFFNANPSGRILNRFSKDIGGLDEALPMVLLNTIHVGLAVLATFVIIGSLSFWILVPTILVFSISYWMRVVFLRTSRNVKRVESVTRSPIYTHLAASLQGLTTIRAFKAENILRNEFDNHQNHNSAASYMFLGATSTFGFWLDFICVNYMVATLVTLLFVESESFSGSVGLAITQSMSLTGILQWGMRYWSEMENQMTSVERVQEYTDLKPESQLIVRQVPRLWPEAGNIKFKNVFLRYSPNDPCVLQNLSFEIKSKEKIGVVGRTGAGKSSLIQALFRLVDIEGSISIDDIDTKYIPLRRLRMNLSIIPQEPVLFSGTLRRNLDPFNEYRDEVLWNALEEVELKNLVNDLPSGLDNKMAEGGSNFSVGQRQLVCLARAILRNNIVLVLDEATSNVDTHTDSLIQNSIRRKFSNCTVLTIAHRLHTIMDSNKVLVMEAGQVVEFDHPHKLLANETGVFYKLVMETGGVQAKTLIAIAEKNYRQHHGSENSESAS